MTLLSVKDRQGLPENMQFLLRDYPREAWPDHPNFARSIQNWMGAHQMFRQLGDLTQGDCEALLDNTMSTEDFARRTSYYGNLLVRNLHGHHTWEDRDYFPELRSMDGRFDQGLEILESDHVILDEVLNDFTQTANRSIKLLHLDEKAAYDEIAKLYEYTKDINSILSRHLQDEEELVVPILLHYKMRG